MTKNDLMAFERKKKETTVNSLKLKIILKIILKNQRPICWTEDPGSTKGGSITLLLTSCLTGLESTVWQLMILVFIYKTD